MHAETVDSAVKRLTQKPMDIAPAYIPLMHVICSIHRVHLNKGGEMRACRRMTAVEEILDYEKYRNMFTWKPGPDDFASSTNKSALISNIGKRVGKTEDELLQEVERRKNVLMWMRQKNIRSYRDVAAIVTEYYLRPEEFYTKKVESVVAPIQ